MTPPCPLCDAAGVRPTHQRVFQDRTWSLQFCPGCGLYFTDPVPNGEQLQRFYSGDYHAQLRQPGASERVYGARFQRYAEWIASLVPPGRTLEVGCATGLLSWMLQQRGYAAEGIDLDEETVRWGAAHYGVNLRAGGLDVVASQPGSYDLVTLTEVVEHTPQPIEFLRAVHHLLKPGGYALVTFPDITAAKSGYYRRLAWLTQREWIWLTCHMPLHTWEFSPATAQRTFECAGFGVVGFRRSESVDRLPGKLAPLTWPARLLCLGALARRFGSQMEFMIRKPA